MSALKTYDIPPPEMGMAFENIDGGPLAPGCWVKHHDLDGFGIVIAINDEQLTILWSQEPRQPLTGFAAPLVRRVVNPLIAKQLVSIQPMSLPSGLIFYMDYKYGCKGRPWWSSLIKKARCTPSLSLFSLSWSRSQSTKNSTSAVIADYETKLLDELVSAGASLKERAVRRRFGRTVVASEEPESCPPAAPEKTPTE